MDANVVHFILGLILIGNLRDYKYQESISIFGTNGGLSNGYY